jgi:hypothetical protein
MPVTARLSQALYHRLGDQVAGELVTWFNTVDDTTRTELRLIGEALAERVEARMAERFALQDERIEARFRAQDEKIDARFAAQDAKIEAKFAQQDAKIERLFAQFEARMNTRIFAFFVGQTAALAAIMAGMLNAARR